MSRAVAFGNDVEQRVAGFRLETTHVRFLHVAVLFQY